MTKYLEDDLNLPHIDEIVDQDQDEMDDNHSKDLPNDGKSTELSERIDNSLGSITGLEDHDNDMDTISKRALAAYDDLVDLGKNMPANHSHKVYEVAGQLLKTALDAKDAKSQKKLKMLDLQIKKLKVDADAGNIKKNDEGNVFDRNWLLKEMRDSAVEAEVEESNEEDVHEDCNKNETIDEENNDK